MSRKFDDQLNESLIKGTDLSIELKENIWNQIEQKLDCCQKGELSRMKKRKKRMVTKYVGIGTAAAFIILFLAGTSLGHAMIDKIKDLFAPEKMIVEELEGMEEERNVQLQKSRLGYVIYFDEEMFTMENIDGKDRIAPKTKADYVPEVFMEIEQVENKDAETLASEIEKHLKKEFETVKNLEEVESPIRGILIYGLMGNRWDDIVVRYYLVDNTQGGTFVIKQQFFFEAMEGFGERFNHMLKEFQIIKLKED